jgi:hypothetical protein
MLRIIFLASCNYAKTICMISRLITWGSRHSSLDAQDSDSEAGSLIFLGHWRVPQSTLCSKLPGIAPPCRRKQNHLQTLLWRFSKHIILLRFRNVVDVLLNVATCYFSIALVLGVICGLFFFSAPRISASCWPLDSTTPLLSRAGIRSRFFHMQYFVKNIDNITKPMWHPFQTDMPQMCHACEMQLTRGRWKLRRQLCHHRALQVLAPSVAAQKMSLR